MLRSRFVLPTLMLVLAAAPVAAQNEASPKEPDPGVTLRLVEPFDLLVGQLPVLDFEIRNTSGGRVRLVRPLYDSFGHRRYPKLTLEVLDAKGKALSFDRKPGPEKQPDMYESAFIVLTPGQTDGFELQWPFTSDGITEAGSYTLRLIYDTRAPSLEAWNAWPPEDQSELDNPVGRAEMSRWLEQVKPVRLVAEAKIKVHELTDRTFRTMLVRGTRDASKAKEIDQAFESGAVKIAGQRRMRGATFVDLEAVAGGALPDAFDDSTYVVQPATLRPSVLKPFEEFRGATFVVDAVSRLPAWRRQKLGLPPAGR